MDEEINEFISNPLGGKFLGIQSSYDKALFGVIPAPYDKTASWKKGTRFGPERIIRASQELEFFDTEFKERICESAGVYTFDALDIEYKEVEDAVRDVKDAVFGVAEKGRVPVLLGGEHSVTIGAVDAFSEIISDEFSVLQIDAHADLRNEYLGSRYNHACVMRRVREKVDKVVQVGVRTYSQEEYEYIQKKGIQTIYGKDFDIEEVLSRLGKDVYITIDMDGFDPGFVPAVGTPYPGGLDWETTLNLLRETAKRKNIVGFDAVELMALPGDVSSDMFTAALIYKLMAYIYKFK
ncbi:agmatinase [Candidatus Micrarchaeota archaeon]|nr:agmatinase [Candidatus Micrarchaeota archaeon]